MESRELNQIQISETHEKPASQLYYERYINKKLNNIFFVNKMLFKLRKVESPLCSFCKAKDKTYIHHFYSCRKTSILWRQLQEFFSTAIDLSSISPQSAIFGFLDDVLEHKLLINHILLIFKYYLYKARENKDLNFNVLKNYLTKIKCFTKN